MYLSTIRTKPTPSRLHLLIQQRPTKTVFGRLIPAARLAPTVHFPYQALRCPLITLRSRHWTPFLSSRSAPNFPFSGYQQCTRNPCVSDASFYAQGRHDSTQIICRLCPPVSVRASVFFEEVFLKYPGRYQIPFPATFWPVGRLVYRHSRRPA